MANINKYSSKHKQQNKIIQTFDAPTLDLMCAFALSDDKNISINDLNRLKQLIDRIDKEDYKDSRLEKIEFIEKVLEAKINFRLSDKRVVLSYLKNGCLQEDIPVDIDSFSNLTTDELRWLNTTIADALSYTYIDENSKNLMEVLSKFQAGEYKNKSLAAEEFKMAIQKAQKDIREADIFSEDNDDMFILSRKSEQTIRNYYQKFNSPANKLLCGLSGLNDMLNGGFESGRIYMIYGLPGEGKSMTLLDLALQITRYNANVAPKNSNNKCCVLMLSMENIAAESLERIWNMTTSPDDMIKYEEDECIDMLFGNIPETNIDFIFQYKPGDSCTTEYCYELIDKVESMGYEVVCFVQDYVKLIKPVEYSNELRISLGNVVKEFKVLAKTKDIPVISASQLNREASKHIDEGRKSNKPDLVMLLGRDNIGESMIMLDFADASFMIAPEVDYNGAKFLGIQRVKKRFKAAGPAAREHLYQPYINNSIKLVEDQYAYTPMYKDTLKPPMPQNFIPGAMNMNSNMGVANISEVCDLRVDGAFNNRLSGMFNNNIPVVNQPISDDKHLIKPFIQS